MLMVGKAEVSPAQCMDDGYHVQCGNVSIIRTSERWASGCWKKVRFEREIIGKFGCFWGGSSVGGLMFMQRSSWVCPPDSSSWIFGGSICFSGRAVEYLSSCVLDSAHTSPAVLFSQETVTRPTNFPPSGPWGSWLCRNRNAIRS